MAITSSYICFDVYIWVITLWCFTVTVPGYISRSVAGSYDNEGIAIFALMFTYFLWVCYKICTRYQLPRSSPLDSCQLIYYISICIFYLQNMVFTHEYYGMRDVDATLVTYFSRQTISPCLRRWLKIMSYFLIDCGVHFTHDMYWLPYTISNQCQIVIITMFIFHGTAVQILIYSSIDGRRFGYSVWILDQGSGALSL